MERKGVVYHRSNFFLKREKPIKKSDFFKKRNILKNKNEEMGIKNFFNKFLNKKIIIFMGVFLLILIFLLIFLFLQPEKKEKFLFCGDGTFYNTCSLDKPFYCEEGVLFEKSSICGCGGQDYSLKENSCFIKYHSQEKLINFTYFLRGEKNYIEFLVFEGVNDYISNIPREITYFGSQVSFRSDFKQKSINDEIQRKEIIKLVKKIQNIAPDDKIEQARIAISLVQNIPYFHSNKTSFFGKNIVNHSRYPYEVLYENKGICGEKSNLLVLILRELGYGTSIFYFSQENHEAVGIKCPIKNSFKFSGYCFIETSGPSIISDYSMEFSEGLFLKSEPEIIITSEGISLPKNLYEYSDARTLSNIRKKNLLGILNSWRLNSINKKYGLFGELNNLI